MKVGWIVLQHRETGKCKTGETAKNREFEAGIMIALATEEYVRRIEISALKLITSEPWSVRH
jgi:hypothetical protein